MTGMMLASMSIQDQSGIDVPLMLTGYRRIKSVDGLAGMTVREKLYPATGRHGSINRTRFRDSREIHLTGWFLDEPGSDPARAWLEYHTVAAALGAAVDTDRLLKWTAGSLDLQSSVRLVEAAAPIEVGPALIEFDITLRAADPRAYSQTEHTAFVMVLGSS